jgi:hypothetical protein
MVKIDNNFNQTHKETNQTSNCGFDTQTNPTNQQTQSSSTNEEKFWSKPNSGLFSLPPAVMKLVP